MSQDSAIQVLERFGYDRWWVKGRSKLINLDSANGATRIKALSLRTEQGHPFLLLALESNQKAEALVKAAIQADPLIEIGGWVEGEKGGSTFLRLRRRTGGFEYVPGPASVVTSKAVGLVEYKLNGSERAHALKPVDESFERILFEAHSAVRDIDGLHPDEALDELCKLIYAKLYDEERAGAQKRALRFQLPCYVGADEAATAIRHLYAEACEYDGRVFSLKIAGYQRSRGVFTEPIHLSGAAINQVVKLFQSLSFLRADVDVKGRAFQKVLGPTFRGALGQYFTPTPIIEFLVNALAPSVDDLVLDPFCGSGHFLATALEYVRSSTKGARRKLLPEFAFGKLHGLEVSSRMVRVAMTDMRLQGDGHSNIRCADALLSFSSYGDLAPETFDIVLTNPPFGSLLGREALSRLAPFELAKKGTTPLELLGLERSIQFLRPGGKLGIVLPESVLTNRKTQFVRDWLQGQLKIRALVGLPHGTFAPLGAHIKTCLLVGRKWKPGELRDTNYPVWLSELANIGVDATGKPTRENDIPAAIDAFHRFLEKNDW